MTVICAQEHTREPVVPTTRRGAKVLLQESAFATTVAHCDRRSSRIEETAEGYADDSPDVREANVVHDISVIRPEIRAEQIRARGQGYGPEQRAAVKKGLHTFHTLEIMAVNIYKYQITRKPCALNTILTAAMCNEMTHMQDFQTKLYEHGFRPSKMRWTYWMVGYVFGLGSRMLGTRWTLKTGVWVETKAVHHYSQLLAGIKWDEETRAFIEKDQADEQGHIERWRFLLEHPEALAGRPPN
jgi:demethoxyubiquinone hydroxylase (CLK1/Coq7/Cat5 family)